MFLILDSIDSYNPWLGNLTRFECIRETSGLWLKSDHNFFHHAGLSKEGRRLKRLCRKCSITSVRLPEKVTKKYEVLNRKWAFAKKTFPKISSSHPTSEQVLPSSRHKYNSTRNSRRFQKDVVLGESVVKLDDVKSKLCFGYDGSTRICGTNIRINSYNFSVKYEHGLCKRSRCWNSQQRLTPKVPAHEVIDLVSDEDSEPTQSTANLFGSNSKYTVGDENRDSDEISILDVEADDSDNKVTVSKRLEESFKIFNGCELRDLSATESSDSVPKAGVAAGHQPTTHLFKCHACKDVEQLYHRRASLYIQQHMSIVHEIKLDNMYNYLVEHQQDFGTYFVIVVEAFPNLSASPSKYKSNLKLHLRKLLWLVMVCKVWFSHHMQWH